MDPKVPQENLESLGFIPSVAKPEMGKEVGGDEGPAHQQTGRNQSG